MGLPYDPVAVERRWSRHWEEHRTHVVDLDGRAAGGRGAPFTNLVEFPYVGPARREANMAGGPRRPAPDRPAPTPATTTGAGGTGQDTA